MIQTNEYYEEFIRYFHLAKDQQSKTNLGWQDPATSTTDALMNNVYLYDVVERGLAGFSQIVHDCFHGSSDSHPYYEKMKHVTPWAERQTIIARWDSVRKKHGLVEWLYIFMVHRLTGSAINYGTIPSGYHNSILFDLWEAETIDEMRDMIKHYNKPMFSSIGYQIAAFPKMPQENLGYDKPGKYFMCELLPDMMYAFARYIEVGGPRTFREMMDWLEVYSNDHPHFTRVYWFHYAAFLADIADWFPEYVYKESMFFYGTNAVECISYLAERPKGMNKQDFLDGVMQKAEKDTGGVAYNLEDVACDFIRWTENYVQPGKHYAHVDRDKIWSSSNIKNHPYGRQEAMLRLCLIDSFNNLNKHAADDYVLKMNNLSVDEYKEAVAGLDWSVPLAVQEPSNLTAFF